MNVDLNSPVWQLTVGDFLDLIHNSEPKMVMQPVPVKAEKYAYGLEGLCQLFNCSKSTAMRIKKSGVIDKAIKQKGRTIVIDKDMALELFGKNR